MPVKDEHGNNKYQTGLDKDGQPVYITIPQSDFPMSAAPIAGLAIAWVLFVPYTLLFISVMKNRQKGGARHRTVVSTILTIIYILSLAQLIVDIFDVVYAYAFHKSNSIEVFLRESNPVSSITNSMLFICSTTTDALLIWRLYVIWDSKILPIVLPGTAWVAAVLFGPAVLIIEYMGVHSHRYTDLYFALSPGYFGLTFVVNVSVTGLIIGKIWWVQRKILPSNVRTKRLARSFARAVIESGIMYTVFLVVYSILWVAGYQGCVSFLTYPFICVIGMAPTLIIYRLQNVGEGRSTPEAGRDPDPEEKGEPFRPNRPRDEESELVWNRGNTSGGSSPQSQGKKPGERHKSNFFHRNGTPTKKARRIESVDVGNDSFFDGITDSTATTSTAPSANGVHVITLDESEIKEEKEEDSIKESDGEPIANMKQVAPPKTPTTSNVLVVPLRPEETISAEVVYIDGDATGTLMLPETSPFVAKESTTEKPEDETTQKTPSSNSTP